MMTHLLAIIATSTSTHAAWPPAAWGPPPPMAPMTESPLPRQHVVEPMIFPVLAHCRVRDDYGFPRAGFLHTAIDIAAPKMTPIVAPIDGTIGFKTETFWIHGDDGWSVLGTHLNDDDLGTHNHRGGRDVMFAPNLVPGQRVFAGQFLGYVGMSGNATGPHLHFELYAPGGCSYSSRLRDPIYSLRYAQRISSPRVRLSGALPADGELRLDGCVRKVDRGFVTLLLVARESSKGTCEAELGPRYVRFKVSDAVAEQCGGWSALSSVAESQEVSCYLTDTDKPDDAAISRLVVRQP